MLASPTFEPIKSVLFAAMIMLVSASTVYSAPSGALGKSLVMTFTETFQARRQGTDWRSRRLVWSLKIYVGTKGQLFTRVSTPRLTTERAGRSTKAHAGGRRSFRWSGRRLVGTASATSGGLRRITVSFNAGFTNCSARIIVAKRPAARIVRVRRNLEMLASSWRARPNGSCRVVNGNVFK